MSDTPETDKARMKGYACHTGALVPLDRQEYLAHPYGHVVFIEVAQKLERERDGARREKDGALKERDAVWNSWSKALDEAREQLARVRKELAASNRGAEKNAKINQGLCARLAEAERERDEARRERDEALKEEA